MYNIKIHIVAVYCLTCILTLCIIVLYIVSIGGIHENLQKMRNGIRG